MKLRLTLISCPPAQGADTQRHLATGRLALGRGPDNDWVLRDQERALSKNHCVVEFKSGVYVVIDCSTNGVFHNESLEPLGRGNSAVLADGDRLRFGAFVVKAQFVDDEPPPAAADPFLAVLREPTERASPPFVAEEDPFVRRSGSAAPVAFTPIPDDDDFLGLLPTPPAAPAAVAESAWRRDNPDWNPAADRDDAAGVEQAWVQPAWVQPVASAAAIPDDWDEDLTPAEPSFPPSAAFAPPPADDGGGLERLARQARAAAAALDAVLPGGDDPERQASLHMRALLAAARRALAEAGLPVERLEAAYRQELDEGTTR